MPDNDDKQKQQQAQQASRAAAAATRKPLLDSTNLLGAAVWSMSTVITTIALMLVFVKLPASCMGDRGQLLGSCAIQLFTSIEGIVVGIAAVFMQLLGSAFIWRIPNPVIKRLGYCVEWLINFVGLYWLFCVQFDIEWFRPVYIQLSTVIKTMTIGALLAWTFLIAMSIGWPIVEKALFNAPRSGPPGGVQRR